MSGSPALPRSYTKLPSAGHVATTFKSVHHPGDTPRGIVYTRFLARPLGACTIPLMIGATTSALLEQPIWGYVVWGFPAALGGATLWAQFSMARTTAEIRLRSGQAALRSVHDVLHGGPVQWEPIYNVRTTSWHTELSVGRSTHELHPKDWPEYDTLSEAARHSFHPERAATQRSKRG